MLIAFGSNIGDSKKMIESAVEMLHSSGCLFLSSSSYFNTMPWGVVDQNRFLNAVGLFKTGLSPDDLLSLCLNIESHLGRQKRFKWGPREIDIDIIYYSNLIIRKEGLIIPHPHLYDRLFVLEPLNELVPYWIDPVKVMTVRELFENCDNLPDVHSY